MHLSKKCIATCVGMVSARAEQLISAFPLLGGLMDMYNNNILTYGLITAVRRTRVSYCMLPQSLHQYYPITSQFKGHTASGSRPENQEKSIIPDQKHPYSAMNFLVKCSSFYPGYDLSIIRSEFVTLHPICARQGMSKIFTNSLPSGRQIKSAAGFMTVHGNMDVRLCGVDYPVKF